VQQTTLKRAFSLPLLTFYGLGTILGAGIYVLIGEVAGSAGIHAPLAFAIASVLAGFSAFSYAELSARYPLSAGEAVYTQRAFGKTWLAMMVGFLIVLIGMVSTATLVNGFVGYMQVFVHWPVWLIITLLVVLLVGVAMWGISESAWLAAATTLVEMSGLLLILWVALPQVEIESALRQSMDMSPNFTTLAGIFGGAFIAFYAFIGFEDIVNVAEEVRDPCRTLPRAVLLSLAVATLLYMAVAVVAVAILPPAELAKSDAPLALVYQQATGKAPLFIGLVGLAAVINGALIQIVMASRVLYGMAEQGWIPRWLSAVHPLTRTPLHSTSLIGAVILILALWLPLVTLAKITSLVTLVVFSLINLSLWRIKRYEPRPPGVMVFPVWLPIAGFFFSSIFALFQLWHWFMQ
jgi:basic amino acid/polyamine antiporter, APA family